METYQKREHRYNLMRWGAGAGAVAAAVIYRRPIAAFAISGLESAAKRHASFERSHTRFAISTFARDLRHATDEFWPREARMAEGKRRLLDVLSDAKGPFRWSREQAGMLFDDAEAAWYWTRRDLTSPADKLASHPYQRLLASVNASHGYDLDQVRRDIVRAHSAARIPSLHTEHFGSPAIEAQVNEAIRLSERRFLEQMSDLTERPSVGRTGWGRLAMARAGIHQATLGDVLSGRTGIADDLARELEVHARLIDDLAARHGMSLRSESIRVQGIWNLGDGRFADLRGVPELLKRAGNYASTHFQIPVIPYISGFSPTHMAPWLAMGVGDKAAFIGAAGIGRQIGIADQVAGETAVALIGGRGIAAAFDASRPAAEAVRELSGRLSAINTKTGLGRRFAENIFAWQDAEGATPGGVRDALGFWGSGSAFRQHQVSNVERGYSVYGKLSDPTYQPRALQLIYESPAAADFRGLPGDVQQQSLRRLAGFLIDRGSIAPDTVRSLLRPSEFADTPFADIMDKLGDDHAVARWFFDNADELRLTDIHSAKLRQLTQDFRGGGFDVLNELHQISENSLINVNILGGETPRTGYDMLREGLIEEYVLRYNRPSIAGPKVFTPIEERLASLGLSSDELLRARSFIYGTELSHVLREEGVDAAISEMVGRGARSLDIKATAEQMANRRLKLWQTHTSPAQEGVPTRLILREHESILGQINEGMRSGRGLVGAIFDALSSKTVTDLPTALTRGLREPGSFTTADVAPYFFMERLNTALGEFGVGLGPRDLGSSYDILRGLALKRVLPAWAAYEGWNYANYEGENLFGTNPRELAANVNAHLRLGRAAITGWLDADQVFPGIDHTFPFAAGVSARTYSEEREQLASGYEPVRSGRYWFFGSRTQFMGDRIRYFLPDSFQRAHANWMAAENADLSSDDYWAHSILPTPRYPLSTINHFLDPYWWERKHSMGENPDRPYVVSGPMFTPETPWGPALNATAGRLLKPKRVLHPEYLPENLPKGPGRGVGAGPGLSFMVGSGSRGGLGGGYGVSGGFGEDDYGDGDIAEWAYAADAADSSGAEFTLHQASVATITPSGAIQVKTAPPGAEPGWVSRREMRQMNRDLAAEGRAPGRLGMKDGMGGGLYLGDGVRSPDSLDLSATSARELMGVYGWAIGTAEGTNMPTGVRMDDPSHAYGFSPRFWNAQIGGLGGNLSEIGRRFLYKRPGTVDYYNPVPNQFAGTWLPGAEYFENFQAGDQYADDNRLLRLPGEAYERLHGVKLMQTRASSLGKSVDEIAAGMMNMRAPLDEFGEDVTSLGTEWHARIQGSWAKLGAQVGAEVEVYDPELGASGHIDAVVNIAGQPYIGEIKTMGRKRYESGEVFPEHLAQLNFYMHVSGVHQGVLLYVNRDDPREMRFEHVNYSPILHMATRARVAAARRKVEGYVASGQVPRAQLYDYTTRFEILSDVAPYSDQWFELRDYLAHDDQMSEAQNARYQSAKERASAVKERYALDGYRFAHQDLETRMATVEEILDVNRIKIVGDDRPIRLAGVQTSEGRAIDYLEEHRPLVTSTEDMNAPPAERLWALYGIRPGSRIVLGMESDEEEAFGQDLFRSHKAVIYRHGVNVNRSMLSRGIAIERENDYSAPGIEARFSEGQQLLGRLFEGAAHADTPFNTKFMRVRSPYEEYIRSQVYGKLGGGWTSPIHSYIIPTAEAFLVRNPVSAGVSAALFASMFGSTAFMKQKLALYVGGAATAGSALMRLAHPPNDDAFIPPRVEKRREIEEYYDILTYLKYKGLYEYAAERAEEEEGVDVERLIEQKKAAGERNKRAKAVLEVKKRGEKLYELTLGRLNENSKDGRGGGRHPKGRDLLSVINDELKRIADHREVAVLGPWATQALLYRSRYEATMYAADYDTDVRTLIRAFPKYEREILAKALTESTPAERKKLYELLPDYQKRLLGTKLGVVKRQGLLPKRESLQEYFKTHTLPGADWAGWSPQVDLQMLKARAVSFEGIDPMDFGIYPQTIAQAEETLSSVEVPTVSGTSDDISRTLKEVMSGHGIKNLRVVVNMVPDRAASEDAVDVAMQLTHDRRSDFVSAMRRH